MDSRLSRIIQSFLIYILFLGINSINLDFALSSMSVISTLVASFYYRRDGFFYINVKKFVISLAFLFVGTLLIILKQPTIEEIFTIVVKQGMAEELIFRLGMLGVLRIHLTVDSIMEKETLAVLVLNTSLFSLLHQNIFISLFVLSMIYGYVFLKVGIVSSIVIHALWNFYHNVVALMIVVLVIVMYELAKKLHSRKRPFFRWYRRSINNT